jgi:glycosyltransferase involved in cell wall biosynthesis
MRDGIVAVIPAYNEEIAIGTVVLKTKKYVDRVIVVDDGSIDRTAEVAELAGAEVVKLNRNHGKAHALMAGFRKAMENNCSVFLETNHKTHHLFGQIFKFS